LNSKDNRSLTFFKFDYPHLNKTREKLRENPESSPGKSAACSAGVLACEFRRRPGAGHAESIPPHRTLERVKNLVAASRQSASWGASLRAAENRGEDQ